MIFVDILGIFLFKWMFDEVMVDVVWEGVMDLDVCLLFVDVLVFRDYIVGEVKFKGSVRVVVDMYVIIEFMVN